MACITILDRHAFHFLIGMQLKPRSAHRRRALPPPGPGGRLHGGHGALLRSLYPTRPLRPTRARHRLPGPEAGEPAPGRGRVSEGRGFWVRQADRRRAHFHHLRDARLPGTAQADTRSQCEVLLTVCMSFRPYIGFMPFVTFLPGTRYSPSGLTSGPQDRGSNPLLLRSS